MTKTQFAVASKPMRLLKLHLDNDKDDDKDNDKDNDNDKDDDKDDKWIFWFSCF